MRSDDRDTKLKIQIRIFEKPIFEKKQDTKIIPTARYQKLKIQKNRDPTNHDRKNKIQKYCPRR